MYGTKEIGTERLLLRKIRIDDYEDIYKSWTSDEKVCKYVTWNKHKSSDETKELVKYWVNEYNSDYTYRWLVVEKDNYNVIGIIDVINKNIQYMTCEVGYCYGSKYWGKGYATEALKAVIDYLHKEGFPVVYAEHFESNITSGKVMQKAGMIYEATLSKRVINKEGNREDLLVYASIKE